MPEELDLTTIVELFKPTMRSVVIDYLGKLSKEEYVLVDKNGDEIEISPDFAEEQADDYLEYVEKKLEEENED